MDPDVKFSNRGFQGFEPIPSSPTGYSGSVRVYESSAASDPYIWLAVDESRVHLTLADARRLRDQIDYLISNHYQAVS